VVIAKEFLNNKQKLVTLEAADISTLHVFDQQFAGSSYCKEWAVSNVFSFHNVKLKSTFHFFSV